MRQGTITAATIVRSHCEAIVLETVVPGATERILAGADVEQKVAQLRYQPAPSHFLFTTK